jgi:small-conductance mechanosensitive channel
MHELLTLLADERLAEQGRAHPYAPGTQETDISVLDYLDSSADAIRNQIILLARAIPNLADAFEQAATRIFIVDGFRAFSNLAIFAVVVLCVDLLFRIMIRRHRRRLDALPVETVNDRLRNFAARSGLAFAAIGGFAVGGIVPFLVLDWQPITRATVFGFMLAVVLIRIAIALGDLLLAPDAERRRIVPMDTATARFWNRRFTVFASAFGITWVIVQEAITLGLSFEEQQLIGYSLGLAVVGIALEAIWRRPVAPRTVEPASNETHQRGWVGCNALLSIGVTLLWVLWVAAPGVTRVNPAFWFVLVIMTLSVAIPVSHRAIKHLFNPRDAAETSNPPNVIAVSVEHGVRALLILGAVAVLAWGWNVDLVHLAGRDTLFARIVHGVLTTVVILLLADVLWQIVRAGIDGKLGTPLDERQLNTEEGRRRARLHTLLPIFRNLAWVLVIAIAAMTALAELGVEIGPLIAGASIIGVAIGFGAQTFVRDIIAGMFYLLDDAFRVGEYIQAGNYKGTVEGFSIRSVRLRHHRGPVYTVPFSLLGAIQNQSRDWVIDKMMIGITYDSDLERARKLIKQIGLELAQDPEYAPLIIEPLKMQGVEELGHIAVRIRMKMMTLPGEQFVIRRKAYAMIKKAFDENGIKFAFPTVQVAGEAATPSTAAAAQRTLELIPGGLTEGDR